MAAATRRKAKCSPPELLRRFLPPMLATLAAEPPRSGSDWILELKYDGFRGLAAICSGQVALWSRNALDLGSRFPPVVDALRVLGAGEAVLDGEIVSLDSSGAPRFQLLQQSVGRDLVYFVFDLLWLDGNDLRRLSVEQRRELLEKLIGKRGRGKPIVRLSEGMHETPVEALKEAARRGYEGLIAKRRGSTYENRRSREWLKIKAVNVQEAAVVGFTESTHSDSELGSLILGVVDNGQMRYAGRVGTGFTYKQRVELKKKLQRDAVPSPSGPGAPRIKGATWVRPRLVAQVRFAEWTADGMMRHPAFLGLRPDKKPEECMQERPMRNVGVGTEKTDTKKTASAPSSPAPPGRSSGKKSTPVPKTKEAVTLTSPDRLLFPRDGITKQHVADYYQAVSGPMIDALDGRPLSLEHWNSGIDKPSWFQQNMGKEAPSWATLVSTPTRTSKRNVRHLVIDRPETLRWLAQMSVLTIHMWSSRAGNLENPDWVIFDLDPAKGKGMEQAIDTALVLRRLFDELEIPTVPKTSGKRGIHLLVPLVPKYSHEEATEWGCRLAEVVASKLPYTTTERALASRAGRLYLDCLQNGYGKTIVAPYSLRGIDGGPVSAPLRWSEVTRKLDPKRYNIRTMPGRIAKYGDLFRPAIGGGIKLPRIG